MSANVEKPKKTIPYLFLAIVFVTLALSAGALFLAFFEIDSSGNIIIKASTDPYMLLFGGLGFALSAYMLLMLFQTRRRTMQLEIKEQPVITTILCQKCGFKNVRDFQRGDYIFKEVEPCPKCNEKTSVASIYREVEKKR